MSVSVLAPGLSSSVQDLGRCGHAALGVGRAGALDGDALRLANALVGNLPGAAGIEITLTGPRLRFDATVAFALCGADFEARLDGAIVAGWRSHHAPAGSLLELGHARNGCRAWLALGGGIALPRMLDSRATDLNAALGPLPRALRAGDVLPLDTLHDPPRAHRRHWSLDPRPWFAGADAAPLRVLPGRDHARLDAASRSAFHALPFRVTATSNRVGVRLNGTRLRLEQAFECVSEPLVPGVVQLPPSGQPIILLGEHPVSGGYPRIGQVAAVDLPRLAQVRPGTALRFAPVEAATAAALLHARRRARDQLEARIRARLEQT